MAFVVVAAFLAASIPLAWLLLGLRLELLPMGLMVAPLYAATYFPTQVIALTGGPRRRWRLFMAIHELNTRGAQILAGTPSDSDLEWLANQSSAINLLREPESSDLVDLWQAKTSAALSSDGSAGAYDRDVVRSERIVALQDRLFADFRARKSRQRRDIRTR